MPVITAVGLGISLGGMIFNWFISREIEQHEHDLIMVVKQVGRMITWMALGVAIVSLFAK